MPESYIYTSELPSIIDDPHPYVALGDLLSISQRFIPKCTPDDVASLQEDWFDIFKEIVPDEVNVIATTTDQLNKKVQGVAENEVNRKDAQVGVVIIDRYITSPIGNPSYFRLNVSRDKSYSQINRPGNQTSVDEQYHALQEWRVRQDFDEVIIMDDVLGTGSTLINVINELNKISLHQTIRAFTGIATTGGEKWAGVERVRDKTGVDPEYLVLIQASEPTKTSTGLCIGNTRDLTLLGGYLLEGSEGNYPQNLPNFLPYTKASSMNPTNPEKLEYAAELLLTFNTKYFEFLESRMSGQLTMQSLRDRGFGIPTSNISAIKNVFPKVTPNTPILDHLGQATALYQKHKGSILREVNQ